MIEVIALENSAGDGLVRSLAVVPERQKNRVGTALYFFLEGYARKMNIHSLHLLTETAVGFFKAKGFSSISRDSLPATVKEGEEFKALCPVSAEALSKQI